MKSYPDPYLHPEPIVPDPRLRLDYTSVHSEQERPSEQERTEFPEEFSTHDPWDDGPTACQHCGNPDRLSWRECVATNCLERGQTND